MKIRPAKKLRRKRIAQRRMALAREALALQRRLARMNSRFLRIIAAMPGNEPLKKQEGQ